jgi:hypothetical protein
LRLQCTGEQRNKLVRAVRQLTAAVSKGATGHHVARAVPPALAAAVASGWLALERQVREREESALAVEAGVRLGLNRSLWQDNAAEGGGGGVCDTRCKERAARSAPRPIWTGDWNPLWTTLQKQLLRSCLDAVATPLHLLGAELVGGEV